MSTAITILNDMPAPLFEVVSASLVERHEDLLACVAKLPAITSPESAAWSESFLIELADIERKIEAEVEYRSKPAFQLHRAIVAVGKKALEPIATAKATLRGKIGAWNREQQRLRDEALAKAEAERQAAAAAAEKERQRLQTLADTEHAAQVAVAEAERTKRQAEADAKAAVEQAHADQEAKELAEVLGTPAEAVKVEAAKIVVEVPAAPVVKVEIAAAPAAVIPPPVKSSVITKKVTRLEITDEKLVPAYVAGHQVRIIDKVALRRLLDEGVVIQGARLVEDTVDSMRAVKS